MVVQQSGVSTHIRDMGEVENAPSKTTLLKGIVFILCFLLLAEILVYFVVLPSFKSVKITYDGTHRYSPAVFEQLLGANGKSNWLRFDITSAASMISSFSGVEDVTIEKKFPDTVIITVKERIPVAMTLLTDGNRSVPVMLDKAGVAFPMEMIHTDSGLPLISGLSLDTDAKGMRLDKMYRPLFDQLASLQTRKQQYLATLSEIHVLAKEYGNYELVLYPINSRIRVLMDRNLSEEALQYMMVILDVLNTIKPEVKEVDLRYGAVAYRSTGGGLLER